MGDALADALYRFASFHDQRPTMALGELTADEQPEPSPRLRAEVGIVDPVEALEDLLLLVPWNSDAVVFDDETGAAIVCHG